MLNRFLLVAVILLLLPGAQASSYLHGNGLAAKLDGRLEFYHSDSLGSTRAMTDELGAVIERQLNLPFGGVLEGDEKYGFTGKELDESGLQYFGARYYDSATGRFISTDPAMQYHSPYLYAGNNPLAYRDSDGRFAQYAAAAPFLATPAGWVVVGGMTLFTLGFMAYQATQNPMGNIESIPAMEFPSWNEIFPAQAPIDGGTFTSPAEAPFGMWTETFPAAPDALLWNEQIIPPAMPDMSRLYRSGLDFVSERGLDREIFGVVPGEPSSFDGEASRFAGTRAGYVVLDSENSIFPQQGKVEISRYLFLEGTKDPVGGSTISVYPKEKTIGLDVIHIYGGANRGEGLGSCIVRLDQELFRGAGLSGWTIRATLGESHSAITKHIVTKYYGAEFKPHQMSDGRTYRWEGKIP